LVNLKWGFTGKMERVASIDIGTNTILLLIAKIEDGKIHPLFDMETVARLGEGLQKNGILSTEAMERGLQTLAQYLKQCQEMGAEKIYAVGTSALREAKNSEIFLKMSKEKLDLEIEIISGEEEAQLSFLAVTRDLKEGKESILVVDVGGGSTEFTLGKGGQISQWISLPLGSVRFTEEFLLSDPVQEEEWKRMENEIHQLLLMIPRAQKASTVIAVGGTATTLASVEQGLEEFIPEKIHHFVLQREALEKQVLLYRSKTIAGRKKIPGLPPSRAEVILAGAAILYMAMIKIQCPSVMISCHGVRYGLLYRKLNLEGLIQPSLTPACR
jgi:exopolyphosphatase/guanosine-5'-triphosphate,3'-diphosphate pyrophosphatase